LAAEGSATLYRTVSFHPTKALGKRRHILPD
jgi:hypothetical protein